MDALKKKKMIDKQRSGKVDSPEILKSTPHIIVEIIEYVDNSVVIKTILKKSTGDVGLMSFDTGEGLAEKISPFDTFVQIIEGKAEIFIDGKSNVLLTGQGIVVPAHRSSSIIPNGRFKMISTVIKSGYE
jgi:quercetin dioxygenase-like cupin family protein